MNNIQKMLGLSLLCASLALVGCGGGSGGGGGGGNNNNNDEAQVNTPDETVVVAPVVEEEEVKQHGTPVEELAELPEESSPVVDIELIQPVEDVAVTPQDLNAPGAIAANPEPTTLALGALGAVFLASRRYRRQA